MVDDNCVETESPLDSPIVGIAASAGGLDAFKKLLSHLPADTGAAFVLVPHLDPTHDSMMVEILARETKMPVCEVRDAMRIEPNCVYIIPPNKYLSIAGDAFRLSPPMSRHGMPTAIDSFLGSLASERGSHAIAIILSGTSNHGTVGLAEIKRAGGIVMAQQLETAQYDQMPRNAIATGQVDYILPPEEIASALVEYLRKPPLIRERGALEVFFPDEALLRILELLKRRTKTDFRSYRRKMIARRIFRRMGTLHCANIDDYIEILKKKSDEVDALTRDLLIGVTEFFRDPEAFEELHQQVIANLVLQRSQATATLRNAPIPVVDAPRIRVWVPGCSTGEEAYSIAMLFLDELPESQSTTDLQIFATDVDAISLVEARKGIYSGDRIANLSEDRLRKYFIQLEQDQWQVRPFLREQITFAPQNLICDPPFSRIDLISCRNLLIYLDPSMQSKVIQLFHLALNERGFLFLGPSESIGRESDLFETVSKRWRIFQRLSSARRESFTIPVAVSGTNLRLPSSTHRKEQIISNHSKDLLHRLVLNEFAPAAVLVNPRLEIVSLLGPLVNYLEFPPGTITTNVLEMARPGLRSKLRSAIQEVFKTSTNIEALDAQVKRNGKYEACSISVRPAASTQGSVDLVLVVFRDGAAHGKPARNEALPVISESENSGIVQHLDQELKSTRDELRSTIEEFQSSTEDLKTSSEEVMSMNEELQSANEELESSKEELQSLNEELSTVNTQLQEKVEELDRSNSDLTNLMSCSELAAIFLDRELRIQRFTPSVAALLNLRSTDLERPLSDFSQNFEDDTLALDCRSVLDKKTPFEKVVWDKGPQVRCYLRRIIPYRTSDNDVRGVVITFVDITQRHIAEAQSRRLANVLKDSRDAITIQDFDGYILEWNRGAERMYGYTESEAVTMNIFDTIPDEKRQEARAYVERLTKGITVDTFETQRITKDGSSLDIELTLTPYRDERGRLAGFATTERNVTERKRAAQLLYASAEKMQAILNTAMDSIVIIDARGVISSANPATVRMFGYSTEELLGKNLRALIPSLGFEAQDADPATTEDFPIQRILGTGRESSGSRKNETTFPIDLSVSQVDHLGIFTCIIRDISLQKKLQRQVLEIAEREQRRIGQELHDGTGQELTGLALFAGTLTDLLRDSPQRAGDGPNHPWLLDDAALASVRRISERLTNGLSEANLHVQKLSHGILPVQIEPRGLVSALSELTASTNELKGVHCHFECPEPVLIEDNAMATHLYRIVQESVNNALKHGHPKHIRILLRQDNDQLRLEITDDGQGVAPSDSNVAMGGSGEKGYGMDIMKYRAGMIGGTLRVTHGAHGGVSVSCTIPQHKADAG